MKQYQVEWFYNGEWVDVSMIHDTVQEAYIEKVWAESMICGEKTEFRIVEREVSDWKEIIKTRDDLIKYMDRNI